jgi:hypothetical protein
MLINSNTSNIWNAALKLEGLDGFTGHIEDHEISAVYRAMGILTQEALEIFDALCEERENADRASYARLENTIRSSHLSHLFPQNDMRLDQWGHSLIKQTED